MQKSVPILRTDRNKFSKMPNPKTKTKKINCTADRHFITTDKKEAQPPTTPCRNGGCSGNLKFLLSIIFASA